MLSSIILILFTTLFIYGSAQQDLNCLVNSPKIECSSYNLCQTCGEGIIQCIEGKPVLKCHTCSKFSFVIDEQLYCSSTEGCSQLNQVSGDCEKCQFGYYALHSITKANNIEINCKKDKISLSETLAQIDKLDTYSKKIVYKYALQVLSSTSLVEQVRPIWFYSKYIEECGGLDRSDSFYERCQCKPEYYGSRCQVLLSSFSDINSEISQNIVSAIQSLQTTFSQFTQTDLYSDEYPGQILNILRLIAEVSEKFDKATYDIFNSAQQLMIDFINTKYSIEFWKKPNNLTTNKKEILNWSILYSFISTYAERQANVTDATLLSEYKSTTSTVVKPYNYLMTQLETIYTKNMEEAFTASTVRVLKATRLDQYFHLVKEAITLQPYTLDNVSKADFNFMDLDSITENSQCLLSTDQLIIQYPKFFISKSASLQISSQIATSGTNVYQQAIFIDLFASNPQIQLIDIFNILIHITYFLINSYLIILAPKLNFFVVQRYIKAQKNLYNKDIDQKENFLQITCKIFKQSINQLKGQQFNHQNNYLILFIQLLIIKILIIKLI